MEKKGWYFPFYTSANRFHYTEDGIVSLCGKYGTTSAVGYLGDEIVIKRCKKCLAKKK